MLTAARLDYQDTTNVDEKGIAFTIRSVFVIDPKKVIRTILSYPASTGRNSKEVLRIVDSLQTGDKHKITTPINWVPGDDVIVHPSVKSEQAKELFPEFRTVKPTILHTCDANPYAASLGSRAEEPTLPVVLACHQTSHCVLLQLGPCTGHPDAYATPRCNHSTAVCTDAQDPCSHKQEDGQLVQPSRGL